MANNVSGIFETLVVPAATASAQAARYRNPMIDYCFVDYRGITGTIGQTMNINIPIVDETDVNQIGNGPIQLTDTNHTPKSITINTNMSDSKRIQQFDQIRTPLDLQRLYTDAMVESVLRKTNRQIANLVTSASATATNSSQTGTLLDELSRADVATAWGTLIGQGAPEVEGDLFCVTHHVPYAKALADTTNNWIQQYVIGQPAAEKVQQTARFMPQYGMLLDYDQTMPLAPSVHYYAFAFHRFAIGLLPVLQPQADTGGYVRETTIYPRPDMPFRIQLWYDPTAQGYVLHINCVFGLAVIRPEWCVQIALKTS